MWAASMLCFFGFFRMVELTIHNDKANDYSIHLSQGDPSLDHIAIIGTKKQKNHNKSTTPQMLSISAGLPPAPHKLVN